MQDNKYQEQEEHQTAYDNLQIDIADDLELLQECINSIDEKSKKYGYDFSDDIEDDILTIIYPSRLRENVRKLKEIKADLLKMIGKM